MTATMRLASLALAIAGLGSAGCSILAPRPDPSRFFTLTAVDASQVQSSAAPASNRSLTYGLGPITLPPYLDRNAMALRVSPTEIKYSTVDRWAEPLQVSVPRVLLENIATQLSDDHVVKYPWDATSLVDYRIEVEVLQFESNAAGNSQLVARWRIRDGRNGKEVKARTSSFERSGPAADAAASAAALSAALGELSDEIVTAARQLPRTAVAHK